MPLLTIPSSFGIGGAHLTPSAGSPTLREVLVDLQAAISTSASQRGTNALVAGTFTVNTGIVLTASSKIFLTMGARPGTTTNLACLAVTARTIGAAGVASFTVEMLLTTGAIDADATGNVHWMIVD